MNLLIIYDPFSEFYSSSYIIYLLVDFLYKYVASTVLYRRRLSRALRN